MIALLPATSLAAAVTHVYKIVDDMPIHADVYAGESAAPRPVLMWIHGGALIFGHRDMLDPGLRDQALAAGFAVVSVDYRLAPETSLAEIVTDVEDAYRWIRTEGPAAFGADPDAVVVAGGSAGGYLTLMMGFRATPRPAALAVFWGYGDIIGDWYAEPSEYYLATYPEVTHAEAFAHVNSPGISAAPLARERGAFYLYCRQQGTWIQNVSGHDPVTQAEWFAPYLPVRNVTAAYPPTILVHGQLDTDVPHNQSVLMDKELTAAGVVHELVSVPDAGHGLVGLEAAKVQQFYAHALGFLVRHLPRTQSIEPESQSGDERP
jgi:acetyl esterase/lipase